MSGEEGVANRPGADDRLPVNLRELREGEQMSQAALAAMMTERGHPWHQSTVYRVETGKQAATFGEAVSLAEILRVPVDRFAASSPESDALDKVISTRVELGGSARYVSRFVHAILVARERAREALAATEGAQWPRVRTMREPLARDLEKHTLDAAVAEGVRRYEEHVDPEASW
jgi:transcriptional regulator with XRE-family HTH domain